MCLGAVCQSTMTHKNTHGHSKCNDDVAIALFTRLRETREILRVGESDISHPCTVALKRGLFLKKCLCTLKMLEDEKIECRILHTDNIEVILVQMRHLSNVPGRVTDVIVYKSTLAYRFRGSCKEDRMLYSHAVFHRCSIGDVWYSSDATQIHSRMLLLEFKMRQHALVDAPKFNGCRCVASVHYFRVSTRACHPYFD